MEKSVRITNGVESRMVTPSVANDKATLQAMGYYVDNMPADKVPDGEPKKTYTEAELDEIKRLAVEEALKGKDEGDEGNEGLEETPKGEGSGNPTPEQPASETKMNDEDLEDPFNK